MKARSAFTRNSTFVREAQNPDDIGRTVTKLDGNNKSN